MQIVQAARRQGLPNQHHHRKGTAMNIYVGNLPFMITEDKLMDHFAAFGEVSSVKLITDKITGEARGFGFVEMPIQSEAEAAIKALNGTAIEGRAMQVNIARDRRR
jgi:RNA recognition motif-containing protein